MEEDTHFAPGGRRGDAAFDPGCRIGALDLGEVMLGRGDAAKHARAILRIALLLRGLL